MPQDTNTVRGHYEAKVPEDIAERITVFLDTLPPAPVDPALLAGLDQFHVGGLAATARLAELCGFSPDMHVLDAGSGLGGPARFLARERGCRVTGVDLSPSFVRAASLLTERAGQAERVGFQVEDLLALPFPAGSFDVVWTQHVAMNIADRAALYGSFRRVLKPGGLLALYDVIWGAAKPELIFPVPWAEAPGASFLLTEEETREVLLRAGFKVEHWTDVTDQARTWRVVPKAADGTNLATVMGPRFGAMTANLGRNLQEGRAGVLMAVCRAM